MSAATATAPAPVNPVKDEREKYEQPSNGTSSPPESHAGDISIKRTAPVSAETPTWKKDGKARSSSPNSAIDPSLQSHAEVHPPPPRPSSRSPGPDERDSKRKYEEDHRPQYEFLPPPSLPPIYNNNNNGRMPPPHSHRSEPYPPPSSRHRHSDSPQGGVVRHHSPSPSVASGVSSPPRRSPPPAPPHYHYADYSRGMPAAPYEPRYGAPPPNGGYYGPPPPQHQQYNPPPPPRYEAYGGLPQPGPARDNYYVSGGSGPAASGVAVTYTEDSATKLSDRVRRRCFNCCTTDTSTWRRSNLNPGKVLCNKCGLFERTHRRSRPDQFPHKRGPLASANLRNPQEMGPPGHVPSQYGPGPGQAYEFHHAPPPMSGPYPGPPEGHLPPPPPPPPAMGQGMHPQDMRQQDMRQQSHSPHANGTTTPASAPVSSNGEEQRGEHQS